MPKQPTWVLIAFITFLILGFLLGTRVYSGCIGTPPGWTTCAFYDVAKDFKEVFGWAIAMYVAYIAATPVWEQLKLMRVDVDISSIKFLEQEIEALKRLRTDVQNALSPLLNYIQSHSQIDENFAWNGNPHAAHDAAQIASGAGDGIKGNGPFEHGVERARQGLIDALSRLRSCFYNMNAVIYVEFDPAASEAQLANACNDEAIAANTINIRIGGLYDAQSQLDAAITNAIAARTELISKKKTAMVTTR